MRQLRCELYKHVVENVNDNNYSDGFKLVSVRITEAERLIRASIFWTVCKNRYDSCSYFICYNS